MKLSVLYLAIAIMLFMPMGTAGAEGLTDAAQATPVAAAAPTEGLPENGGAPEAAPTADTTPPAPTEKPQMTVEPAIKRDVEARAKLDRLSLNVDGVSVELDPFNMGEIKVADLNVIGMDEGIAADWYISSHMGESVKLTLDDAGEGAGVYVYARALFEGKSSYEVTCRCTCGGVEREMTATINFSVLNESVFVPDRIEGIDIIYNMSVGSSVVIEASNVHNFPPNTKWSMTSHKAGLEIENEGNAFAVSATRAGRYVAMMDAVTPTGVSRMAYIVFEVGEEDTEYESALNYSALDIVLDTQRATEKASFFVQPTDSLAYLPCKWTINDITQNDTAKVSLEPLISGVMLYALPIEEGESKYVLQCNIPSLSRCITIPVNIKVRGCHDDITGISFRNNSYALKLDEAITLSPCIQPAGGKMPDDVQWSAYQVSKNVSQLSLNVNEANGQTTILAFRPGTYTVEFAAKLSSNRVYTAQVNITISK